MTNIFDIKNIKKKQLTKNIDLYDFDSEKRLRITNKNNSYETVKVKLDFIDINKSYTIKNLLSDEVFFKTGQKILENDLELLLLPNETSIYTIKEHANVNQYFKIINLILKDKPLSVTALKECKECDFLQIIKTMLSTFPSKYLFKADSFYASFFNDYLLIINEHSKTDHDIIISDFFDKDSDFILFEDLLTNKVYLRKVSELKENGLSVMLEKNSAHFLKMRKVNDTDVKLYSLIYDHLNLRGIDSVKFFNQSADINNKKIVYMCMEMFIPELYEGNEGAVDANFSGGLGILAGCTMEGFFNIGLSACAIIPMYQNRRVQTINENLEQVITEKSVNYANVKKVIDEETGEQLNIVVYVKNKKYVVNIWQISRGGSIVYLLDEPYVFDILYTGSREHRLLQEVLIGKVTPILLRNLNIKPAILHLNEAHPVISAINIQEWKNITNGDDFFEDTRVLFTIHTPRSAGLEVFYTAFEDLEIPYSYKKIFDPENKGKLDFTNAAAEISDRINTVSNNQIKIVKERILTNPKFHHKIIGIMNGSSKSFWMADNLKDNSNLDFWQISQENKKHAPFLDPNKPSAWAVRRIVDYKNQWPFLKDIIRTICGDLGFQVVIGGMAHPNDKASQAWIHEFCNWMHGRWRDDMNKEFICAPELVNNFFFIPTEEAGLGKLLKISAIVGDVCLEIPQWDEEACGTSGMRALGNANICVDSSDGALEWLAEGKNSFMLKPYTKERLLEVLTIISKMYYNEPKKLAEMKKQAFLTWQNQIDIDIMSRRYAEEMFLPTIITREICKY